MGQKLLLQIDEAVNPPVAGYVLKGQGEGVPPIFAQLGKIRLQEEKVLAASGGGPFHLQDPGGAPLNIVAGFTVPVPARTVRIMRGGAGVATVYTITGQSITGAVITEDIPSNGAADVEGTLAYAQLTSITSDVDPTVTTDFVWGNGVALGSPFTDVDAIGVDDVLENPASIDEESGTVVFITEPDGNHSYNIRYRIRPT